MEDLVLGNGYLLHFAPVEHEPPFHWYAVAVGHVVGLFKRAEDAVQLTVGVSGFSMRKFSLFADAAVFVYGESWGVYEPVFVYWGPNGAPESVVFGEDEEEGDGVFDGGGDDDVPDLLTPIDESVQLEDEIVREIITEIDSVVQGVTDFISTIENANSVEGGAGESADSEGVAGESADSEGVAETPSGEAVVDEVTGIGIGISGISVQEEQDRREEDAVEVLVGFVGEDGDASGIALVLDDDDGDLAPPGDFGGDDETTCVPM